MANTEEKVKQVIADVLGLEENQVDIKSTFQEDLGADSLDIVEVVIALEEAFGIDIPDERAEDIRSVNDVVNIIDETVAMNKQSGEA